MCGGVVGTLPGVGVAGGEAKAALWRRLQRIWRFVRASAADRLRARGPAGAPRRSNAGHPCPLEFAHDFPEVPRQFGELLGPENHQGHYKHDDKVGNAEHLWATATLPVPFLHHRRGLKACQTGSMLYFSEPDKARTKRGRMESLQTPKPSGRGLFLLVLVAGSFGAARRACTDRRCGRPPPADRTTCKIPSKASRACSRSWNAITPTLST